MTGWGVRARLRACRSPFALIAMAAPASAAGAAAPDGEDRVYRALKSLRTSLIRIGWVVVLLSIAGYYLAEPVLRYLRDLTAVKLAAFGIPETFFTLLVLALAIGVFLSFPYILYAVLAGIRPLFPAFSAGMMRGFWLASVVLFYAGVLFCLRLSLPYGVEFLLEFEGPHIEALISVEKFVSFCLVFVFGFGILFELPLAMILLGTDRRGPARDFCPQPALRHPLHHHRIRRHHPHPGRLQPRL